MAFFIIGLLLSPPPLQLTPPLHSNSVYPSKTAAPAVKYLTYRFIILSNLLSSPVTNNMTGVGSVEVDEGGCDVTYYWNKNMVFKTKT